MPGQNSLSERYNQRGAQSKYLQQRGVQSQKSIGSPSATTPESKKNETKTTDKKEYLAKLSPIVASIRKYIIDCTKPSANGKPKIVTMAGLGERYLTDDVTQSLRSDALTIARLEMVAIPLYAAFKHCEDSLQDRDEADINSDLVACMLRDLSNALQDAKDQNATLSQTEAPDLSSIGWFFKKISSTESRLEQILTSCFKNLVSLNTVGRVRKAKDAVVTWNTGGLNVVVNAQNKLNDIHDTIVSMKKILTDYFTTRTEPVDPTSTRSDIKRIFLADGTVRVLVLTDSLLRKADLTQARVTDAIIPCFNKLYRLDEKIEQIQLRIASNSNRPNYNEQIEKLAHQLLRDMNNCIYDAITIDDSLSQAHGKEAAGAHNALVGCQGLFNNLVNTNLKLGIKR